MSYVPGKISLSCGVIASYISCIDKITKTLIFYRPSSTMYEVKRADTNDYITIALLCNCIKRKTGLQLHFDIIHKINNKTLTLKSNSIFSIIKTITLTEIETIQIHSYRQFEDKKNTQKSRL